MKAKAKKRPHRRYGWHIVGPDKRLNYGDGRKVAVGKTLVAEGTPKLCHRGMHAAPTVGDCMFDLVLRHHKADAEPWLCRVIVGHASKHRDGKFVGKSRRVLWMRRLTKKLLLRVAKDVRVSVSASWPQHIWNALWYGRRPEVEKWFTDWARRTGCPKKGLGHAG